MNPLSQLITVEICSIRTIENHTKDIDNYLAIWQNSQILNLMGKNMMKNSGIEARAKLFKALGHPTRLKMAEALAHGALCVRELQTLAGSDISTVSKHLNVMREAEVVISEKRGTCVIYSLSACSLKDFLLCAGECVGELA